VSTAGNHVITIVVRWARAILERGTLLALVWWLVSEGSMIVAWFYAVVVISCATMVSLWLVPPGPMRSRHPVRLARFLGWFLWASLRGGADVATRAMARTPRLDPGLITYPLQMRNAPTAIIALADIISLLPGTLAVTVFDDRITVHVLDRRSPVLEGIADAERRIAALFDVTLMSRPDGAQGRPRS
jgi:multicomponent Na+:H+ antiporter subunit E